MGASQGSKPSALPKSLYPVHDAAVRQPSPLTSTHGDALVLTWTNSECSRLPPLLAASLKQRGLGTPPIQEDLLDTSASNYTKYVLASMGNLLSTRTLITGSGYAYGCVRPLFCGVGLGCEFVFFFFKKYV